MSEKTFGAWLLEQTERTDTVGALSRAWKQLKDAGGHGRITRAKSIRELLSGRLGEDWERLNGDQVIMDAENEWSRPETGLQLTEQGEQAAEALGPYATQQRSGVEALAAYAAASLPEPSRYAVLVVNGLEMYLEAGKRYVLSVPVLSEEEPDAPAQTLRDDGSLDWASLYGQADHTVPEGDDLVSLGLLTREEES
jgi:hypothetical protein